MSLSVGKGRRCVKEPKTTRAVVEAMAEETGLTFEETGQALDAGRLEIDRCGRLRLEGGKDE